MPFQVDQVDKLDGTRIDLGEYTEAEEALKVKALADQQLIDDGDEGEAYVEIREIHQ